MTKSALTSKELIFSHPDTASILGLGTASPSHAISQSDSALIAQDLHITQRWHQALPALYRKTGVRTRGSVLLAEETNSDTPRQSFYEVSSHSKPFGPTTSERMQIYAKEAPPLLFRACHAAISQSQINPASITHLLTVSCTGFSAPGSDLELIKKLKLNNNVQRTNIGFMGCHGAINAIRVGKAIVESDAAATVLLGAVELCSIHQQYTENPQQLVANALFADGAAAMIIGSKIDDELASNFSADSTSDHSWTIESTFSQVIPETSALMSWNIGDYGFQMSLDPQVPACIESRLHAALSSWLESQGSSIGAIDGWAIHPGGPRIVQASGASLGLTQDQINPSLEVLANHGNMSSPTILFILDQLAHSNPNAKQVVLLAFGPGLCIEACLLSANLSAVRPFFVNGD